MSTDAKPRILIVDDEEFLIEIFERDLKGFGYRTASAGTGNAAIAFLGREAVDGVLSDVRMPDGTGIDLLKWLVGREGRPPFVFMTGYADIAVDEAMDMGAEGFLNKPMDPSMVREVLSRVLVPAEDRWSVPLDSCVPSSTLAWDVSDIFHSSSADSPRPSIGRGGAFVPIGSGFPDVFDVVRLEISEDATSGMPAIRGVAQVRWVRNSAHEGYAAGVGVEFLSLDDSCRNQVVVHLKRLGPAAYVPLK